MIKALMTWYNEDVKEVLAQRSLVSYKPKTIFYGSSTIRLWDTLYQDFKDYKPINLGFGGSTIAACCWFFDEIVLPVKSATKIIFYAGDNDLGDGRHPEEVCIFYRELIFKLRQNFKKIPFYYISIKPSISRIEIMEKIIYTNKLIKNEINNSKGNEFFINVFDKMITKKGTPIKNYFDADGLHLSKKGYMVWKQTVLDECFLHY
jgi:hypothetical protein